MRSALRAAVSLAVLCVCVFANAGTDTVENKAWDPKKVPTLTEPPLKSSAAEEWKKASETKPTKSCDKAQVWRVLPTSKIATVVTKDMKVPVKGGFDHFVGFVYVDPKTGKLEGGEGQLDLASYDSGVEARDRRVQRYVFNVETPGRAVAPVSLAFNKELRLPAKAPATGELDVDVTMNGTHFRANFPVRISRISPKSIRVESSRDGSFTYVTDDVKPRVLEMMKQCNHHFISNFVTVGVALDLENTCAK